MSFLRNAAVTPDVSNIDKKHGELHEEWRQPPKDEYAIIDGIVMMLKTIAADLPQPQDGVADELQSTRDIIAFALQVIIDSGARMKLAQTSGLVKAYKILDDFKTNKDKYVGDMERLAKSFSQVQMTSETVERWRDVAMWLTALHDMTANAKPEFVKDENKFFLKPLSEEKPGDYPTINVADSFFKSQTKGVSKYTLIYHYGVAAKNLETLLAGFGERNKADPGM
jgi:hypothetical protein